jgi:hypothetical protein
MSQLLRDHPSMRAGMPQGSASKSTPSSSGYGINKLFPSNASSSASGYGVDKLFPSSGPSKPTDSSSKKAPSSDENYEISMADLEKKKVLGEGAFGIVYIANFKRVSEDVAVKELKNED